MSCTNKKEVEEMRDRIVEKVLKSKEMGLTIITVTVERASFVAEMLDEYAQGNTCEVNE